MNDFYSLVFEEEEPLPTAEVPSTAEIPHGFLQKIKAIDWRNVNNRINLVMNILNSLVNIIDAIQRAIAYTNTIRINLPALVSLKGKVRAAQNIVRPSQRRAAPYGGFQPRIQPPYGSSRGSFESLDFYLSSSLNEDLADWEKASIIAGAISAIIALVGQLVNLVLGFPEFKEKIGQLVAGMRGDAEELQSTETE